MVVPVRNVPWWGLLSSAAAPVLLVRVTALAPGDVLAFRAPSGRFHLLAVRAVAENRYGVFPLVRLDFHQARLPPAGQMSQLSDQPLGIAAL